MKITDTTKAKLRAFLQQKLRGRAFEDGDDIFAQGFANSLLAMQLVRLVERESGVVLEDEDLEMDNFRSIEAMADLVARKRSLPAA